MRNVLLMAVVALTLLSACKKDEPSVDLDPVYPDYACLKTGNYWIYERFRVDTLGEATSLHKFDSCYVAKDTLINGETYAKLLSPHPHKPKEILSYYLRDSLHYIVDHTGAIKFSSEDFSTIFFTRYHLLPEGDTMYSARAKMEEINHHTNVPAGEFITMNYKTTYTYNPEFIIYTKKISNMKYANGVGLVVETLPMYASMSTKDERWLVRYHVN